jgi:bacteriorhodopsin
MSNLGKLFEKLQSHVKTQNIVLKEPVKNINKDKKEPVKNINKDKKEPVKNINKDKKEPMKNTNKDKKEPMKNKDKESKTKTNKTKEGYSNISIDNSNVSNIEKQLINNSFYFAYIFLITTGTICFIEALRTKNSNVRHIMNLETCISIVAGYFYGYFIYVIREADKNNEIIDYKKINNLRYTDWFISTPIMLLVLCLVLGMENKIKLTLPIYVIVLLLNFGMLTLGYIGELEIIKKPLANILGFVAFFLMFGYIWKIFMNKIKTKPSKLIYGLFLVLWGFYGVVYLCKDTTKVISYNILDLIAKAFVGIFFWIYFTKIIKIQL